MFRLSFTSVLGMCVLGAIFGYGYYITYTAPDDFPAGTHFTVNEDESLKSISTRLENEHYITSALWFRVWVSSLGKDRHIQLGNYQFDTKTVLGGVVKKFVSESPDKPLIQVTIPEGTMTPDIAKSLQGVLPTFSVDTFIKAVTLYKAQGKLFPSTYYLLPSNTEEDIVKLMTETFEKKYTSVFRWTIIPEPLTKREEVVSLAAIIEGEAKHQEDMRMVAGILIARLKMGMPLQVDVAKETYTTKGIPPIPINNPGIVALDAVLRPTPSEYLYYITGDDGQMYYAKTFAEHKQNIKKHLK